MVAVIYHFLQPAAVPITVVFSTSLFPSPLQSCSSTLYFLLIPDEFKNHDPMSTLPNKTPRSPTAMDLQTQQARRKRHNLTRTPWSKTQRSFRTLLESCGVGFAHAVAPIKAELEADRRGSQSSCRCDSEGNSDPLLDASLTDEAWSKAFMDVDIDLGALTAPASPSILRCDCRLTTRTNPSGHERRRAAE